MTRAAGFDTMDVDTSILDDPKFHRLHRQDPALYAEGVTAYLAVMAASWKAGKRIALEDCWPAFLPFSTVGTALVSVGLLDRRGMIPTKVWGGWFGVANARRESARERWRKANENRKASTKNASRTFQKSRNENDLPRGNAAVAASTVPSLLKKRTEGAREGAAPSATDQEEARRTFREAMAQAGFGRAG